MGLRSYRFPDAEPGEIVPFGGMFLLFWPDKPTRLFHQRANATRALWTLRQESRWHPEPLPGEEWARRSEAAWVKAQAVLRSRLSPTVPLKEQEA